MTTFEKITPTAEQTQKIEALLSAKVPVTLTSIARELGMTPFEASRLLPAKVAAYADLSTPEKFDEFWLALCDWEKVTLMILKDSHVFEIEGKLSPGKRAQGYYNILGKGAAIGGHIAFGEIQGAVFTAIPFMGRESYAVQFISTAGEVSFAVYAGRENHQLIAGVVEAWKAARERFAQ